MPTVATSVVANRCNCACFTLSGSKKFLLWSAKVAALGRSIIARG